MIGSGKWVEAVANGELRVLLGLGGLSTDGRRGVNAGVTEKTAIKNSECVLLVSVNVPSPPTP